MPTFKGHPSLWWLLAANVAPLLGVVFLGWSALEVVLLYCAETFLIGIVNMLKMAATDGPLPMKLFMIPFFAVHFNIFVIGQTFFVLVFFVLVPNPTAGDDFLKPDFLLRQAGIDRSFGLFLLMMGLHHLFSFFFNFIRNGEFREAQIDKLMMAPYGRVVVQQLAAIFGGWLVLALGSPVWVMVILVAAKTFFDLRSHAKAHAFRQNPGPLLP